MRIVVLAGWGLAEIALVESVMGLHQILFVTRNYRLLVKYRIPLNNL